MQAARTNEEIHIMLKNREKFIIDKRLSCLELKKLSTKTRADANSIFGSLTEALKKTTTLQHMVLELMHIGPLAADLLGEGLRVNQSLTRVTLRGCEFENTSINKLAQSLVPSNIMDLDVSKCDFKLKFKDLQPILHRLKKLNIASNDITSATFQVLVEFMKTNTYLTSLNISDNVRTSRGEMKRLFEVLTTNNSLIELDVSSNSMDKEDREALTGLLLDNTTLKTLHMQYTQFNQHDAQGFNALKHNTSLTCLNVSHSAFGDNTLNELIDALTLNTSLKQLHLGNITFDNLNWNGMSQFLTNSKKLEVLNVRLVPMAPDDRAILFEGLTRNQSLNSLDLQQQDAVKNRGLVTMLSANTRITNLSLQRNSIPKKFFTWMISGNSTIKSLNISFLLQRNRMQLITQLVECNVKTLKHLVASNGTTTDELKSFFKALQVNNSITSLTIIERKPKNMFYQLLGDVFQHNRAMRSLTIISSTMSQIDAKHVLNGLKHNRSMTQLNGIVLTGEISDQLYENKCTQQSIVHNVISNLFVFAWCPRIREGLPSEIWREILRFITHPGIDLDFALIWREILAEKRIRKVI